MADELRAVCPHCSGRMRVANRQIVGKTVRCPKCAQPFVVALDAPVGVAAPTRRAVSRQSHSQAPTVDEYGVAVKPLGDPRDRPNRSAEAPAEQPVGEERPEKTEKKRRKKKRKKTSSVPEPSGPKMFLFGFIGGSIGGIVWISIACFLGVHLGIIAILVGVLTGVGVQTGNPGQDSHGPGEIGVFTAFGVILASKYIVVCLLTSHLVSGDEFLKACTPYDIVWCAIAGWWAYRVASGGLS